MGVRYDPIAPESLSEKQKEATRRAVAATENILGRPFVNKTSAHSVCVRALAEIFDQAVFVRIARDPLDVAQSIYRVRTGGDKPRRWIGGRPPEVTSFANQSIAAQSAAQVHYLEEFISGELSEIASTRVLRIRYEDLCRQPAVEVERVCVFMNRNGSPAGLKRPVPCSFPCARGKSVGDEEYEIMKETLQALR